MENVGKQTESKGEISEDYLNEQIWRVLIKHKNYIPIDMDMKDFINFIKSKLTEKNKIIEQKIGDSLNQHACTLSYDQLKHFIFNECVDKTPLADNKDQETIKFWGDKPNAND